MPRTIDPETNGGRTTDHSTEIHALRRAATRVLGGGYSRIRQDAAIELLEQHDAQLVSLDMMPSCANMVNRCLQDVGYGPFLNNGV